MKTTIFFASAALALAACSGDKDAGGETGDSATVELQGPDTDTTTVGYPGGPTLVTYAEVTCDGSDTLTYYAETIGWTTGITVDAADTANTSNWNDYHNLATIDFSEDKTLEMLELNLTTGADPTAWQSDVSTVFTCADHIDAEVMSYIYSTYDESGAQSDCVYWGHDGAGFAAGDYRDFGVASDADHIGCVSLF